jgi:hypothetical protein
VERALTWDGWAGNLEDAPVSAEGRATLRWAIQVIRRFLGENWLADNAAASGHVPLIDFRWWPLVNYRAITRVLELAVRIALVTADDTGTGLSAEATTIYSKADTTGTKFSHLCLTLETAAFAVLAGWAVSYEEPAASGRRPDLMLRRDSLSYAVEISLLGQDRAFRAADRYSDKIHHQMCALEARYGVDLSCRAGQILTDTDLADWLEEVTLACQQTATDSAPRTVRRDDNEISIFAAGKRPDNQVFRGPLLTGDMWTRVARRITDKASQTAGCQAWLRIDDTGPLFQLTDRTRQPLPGLLDDLHANISIALADAPHVRGIILSTGALTSSGTPRTETAWTSSGPAMLANPGPPRHPLATGPAALLRPLPGGRSRATFILPGPHPSFVLPAGADLEPGLWYDDEPAWLTRALQFLGHPPLDRLRPG